MMRWPIALTILIGTLGMSFRAQAGDDEVCCPNCHHVCQFSWEKEKVTKHCWRTECKPICIPTITFPWQDGCAPKCARVKYVNVLKKHEYECERCKYKFTPVCTECGYHADKCRCGHVGSEGGDGGACAASDGLSASGK
ncbi:MAG: hypothetical protein ACYC0X_03730 [Pirellulaceae bacterium]